MFLMLAVGKPRFPGSVLEKPKGFTVSFGGGPNKWGYQMRSFDGWLDPASIVTVAGAVRALRWQSLFEHKICEGEKRR